MPSVLSIVLVLVVLVQSHVECARIVIIGAGMSGISAARRLADKGFTDFLVLEADQRIGGRMKPTRFQGINIEIGANWIEGTVGNPVWDLKQKLDLKGSVTNFSDVVIYEISRTTGNRRIRSNGLGNKRWVEFQKAIRYAETISAEKQKNGGDDISMRVALQLAGWHPSSALDDAIEWTVVDFETAYTPEEISLLYEWPVETFTKYKGEQFMITDPRGYVSIVHDLVDTSPVDFQKNIRLGECVTSIEWNLTKSVNEETKRFVRIHTKSGLTYEADHILVTVSVGVLQNSLQFIPELPFWKKESIFVHEMATYTKIFLKFEHAFWDENEFFIYSSPKRGLYTYWQNFNHSKYFPGSNVIMVTLTTQWARRIELQPKEVTISQIMTVLREMYGNDENPDYPPFPIAYEIPIWYQNEFTFGSYSNWPIGMTPRQKNNLGLNVESTLFFAGEAVNEYSGYVHGAYLSGIDAADELLQLMKVEEL